MVRQSLSSLDASLSAVSRDGFALFSAALALAPALSFEQYDVRRVKFPLFQSAIFLTGWSAGPYSVILAIVVSNLPGKLADGVFHTIFDTGR
jgi:hypothetical protein